MAEPAYLRPRYSRSNSVSSLPPSAHITKDTPTTLMTKTAIMLLCTRPQNASLLSQNDARYIPIRAAISKPASAFHIFRSPGVQPTVS